MTKPRNDVVIRFDEELLGKLLRALGSDNSHEAEAARGRINSLLEKFSGKGHYQNLGWTDLVALLSVGTVSVPPDLIGPATMCWPAARSKATSEIFCWLVFERGYRGEPIIRWLHRDGK